MHASNNSNSSSRRTIKHRQHCSHNNYHTTWSSLCKSARATASQQFRAIKHHTVETANLSIIREQPAGATGSNMVGFGNQPPPNDDATCLQEQSIPVAAHRLAVADEDTCPIVMTRQHHHRNDQLLCKLSKAAHIDNKQPRSSRFYVFKLFCILYLLRHLVQFHTRTAVHYLHPNHSHIQQQREQQADNFQYKYLLQNSFRMISSVEAASATSTATATETTTREIDFSDNSPSIAIPDGATSFKDRQKAHTKKYDNLLTRAMPVASMKTTTKSTTATTGNIVARQRTTRPIDLIKKQDLNSNIINNNHQTTINYPDTNDNSHNGNIHNHHKRSASISGNHMMNEQRAASSSHSSTVNGHHKHRRRSRRYHPSDADGYLDPAAAVGAAADRPAVATQKGFVRGITQKLPTGKFVDAFLGIPFAQAPVGQYRFRHPQAINPWKGELDASRMGSSCYQVNDTFFGSGFRGTLVWNANTPLSEDCLFLNIWTPFGVANTTTTTGAQSTSSVSARNDDYDHYQSVQRQQQRSSASGAMNQQKRSVLIWIFGGGFYSGTSSLALYEGGTLASEEDIIVVSMNYRVSALGFLYFGKPSAPGNSGLFDQLMALQWVNDNISQFGGDPNKVTLFGESAGAVSISFHLLSPLSRNLFQQAIMQSGAATCPWGLMSTQEIIANGLQLASQLNCPANRTDIDAVIDCLLRADPMDLVSQDVGQTKHILNFPFVPVVDGSFLLETPAESLARQNFKRAQILLGSNYDEGNSFLVYLPEYSHCPDSSPSSSSASSYPSQQQASGMSSNKKQQTSNGTLAYHQQDMRLSSNQGFQSSPNSNAPQPTFLGSELTDSPDDQLDSYNLMLSAGERQQYTNSNQQQKRPSSSSSRNVVTSDSNNLSSQTYSRQIQQQQQRQSSSGQNNNLSGSSSGKQIVEPKPCNPIESLQMTRNDFIKALRDNLNPYAKHPIGKDAIIYEYSNWNNPTDTVSNHDAIDKIVGDYYFTCHVNEFAQQYAAAGNQVYMYYFKHRSSVSPWPRWMGVIHADEINFIFGEPLNPQFSYTDKEIEFSRRMMRYWANFAKYGNPTKTADNDTELGKWPEYGDRRQYFELQADSYNRIGRGPRAKQCAFWAHYLPQLLRSFGECIPNGSSLAEISDPFGSISLRDTDHKHHRLFTDLPSFITIGLSVILLAIAVALLFYAKQTGKLHLSNLSNNNSTGNSNADAIGQSGQNVPQRPSGIE